MHIYYMSPITNTDFRKQTLLYLSVLMGDTSRLVMAWVSLDTGWGRAFIVNARRPDFSRSRIVTN